MAWANELAILLENYGKVMMFYLCPEIYEIHSLITKVGGLAVKTYDVK